MATPPKIALQRIAASYCIMLFRYRNLSRYHPATREVVKGVRHSLSLSVTFWLLLFSPLIFARFLVTNIRLWSLFASNLLPPPFADIVTYCCQEGWQHRSSH